MPLTVRHLLLIAALDVLVPWVGDASAQEGMHVTPVEIAQLPQFCWGRYKVPNAVGPEFNMPGQRECGVGTNHYCDGLVLLLRAKGHVNKQGRRDLLGAADTNVRYTEHSIAGYTNCSIRDHVAATRAELDNLMNLYGVKRRAR